MYKAEEEDFASNDASRLDTWVFKNVEAFFAQASEDQVTSEMLHQDRVVFFLHLLGLDTNGHTHKPHSEYVACLTCCSSMHGMSEINQIRFILFI